MTETTVATLHARLELLEYEFLGVDFDIKTNNFLLKLRSLTRKIEEAAAGGNRVNINGELYMESYRQMSPNCFDFFKSLQDCEWKQKNNAYRVGATDSNVATIYDAWPRDRVIFASKEARDTFFNLLRRWHGGGDIIAKIARFKIEGVMPELPAGWTERTDRPLSPYQRAAAAVSIGEEAFAYHMDRGVGKTGTAVQRVNVEAMMTFDGRLSGGAKRPDGKRMMRVLVVCPRQVRLNWQREFTKFATVPGKVSIIKGQLHDRVKQLAEAITADNDAMFSAAIISYDSLTRTLDQIMLVPWDLVITDEAQYFKDPRTNRTKAMLQLRDVCSRRLSLTGSPIGNSVMDLWSQMEFLGHGASGFTSFKTFKDFHGEYTKAINNSGVGVAKLIGLKNIPLLQQRLARMSFSISKEDAGLNLPDKVYSIEEIEMTPYQADLYKRMQDELAIEIEDKLSGDVVDEVTISNVLVQLLRLSQITCGFIAFDAIVDEDTGEVTRPKRIEKISPQNPRVEQVIEMLQDRDPKSKTIIWCSFVYSIKELSEALTAANIGHVTYYGGTKDADRDNNVDKFNNDPECKVIIANPQTAGEGLNLIGYNLADEANSDTYCDLEIFYSNNWSYLQRAQAEDRAHRRGTRMPVQIIDLVAPGTIDEEILDRLTSKKDVAMTVSDLRDTLRRVLDK